MDQQAIPTFTHDLTDIFKKQGVMVISIQEYDRLKSVNKELVEALKELKTVCTPAKITNTRYFQALSNAEQALAKAGE